MFKSNPKESYKFVRSQEIVKVSVGPLTNENRAIVYYENAKASALDKVIS